MNQNLSRREFLKIAGVGLGALAFNPLQRLEFPPPLPQFPEGDRLGRVFGKIDIRSEPSFSAPPWACCMMIKLLSASRKQSRAARRIQISSFKDGRRFQKAISTRRICSR